MGILSRIIAKKATKAAEKIAEASSMTEKQIRAIEEKKANYLKEKEAFDPQSKESQE